MFSILYPLERERIFIVQAAAAAAARLIAVEQIQSGQK
jgi:hypothetical protein